MQNNTSMCSSLANTVYTTAILFSPLYLHVVVYLMLDVQDKIIANSVVEKSKYSKCMLCVLQGYQIYVSVATYIYMNRMNWALLQLIV